MNSLVVLVCLLGLVGQAFSTAASGESAEQSRRRHSCGGLVEEPPKTPKPSPSASVSTVPTPPPGECVCTPLPPNATESGDEEEHSHCLLIQIFYEFSLSLTVQQRGVWEAWVVEIEQSILLDVELSEDEKVVKVALALKKFFSLHLDIALVLEYKQIADWGTCRDLVYVAVSIQLEITQAVVSVNGSNGIPCVEAIKKVKPQCGCSAQDQADLDDLLAQLEALFADSSFTYEQQLAQVSEHFEVFFESHASLKAFLLEVHIEGYGSLESLLEVCHTYKRIVTLNVAISGANIDDCVLFAAMDAASKNSSFDASVQLQIGQLQQKLQLYFQTTVDIKLRLEYVSAQCYQLFKLQPVIIQILEQVSCGEWGGDIYDLIFCSGICTNHGCGNPNQGPGPQGTTTTVSSSSASTPSTSTVRPTTTQMPADCSKCGSLIAIDSQNKTILTDVLLVNYNSWTLAKKSGFNSCFNSIRKAIWDDVAFNGVPAKLTGCRNAFKAYSANNVTIQDEVFNIQISAWMGTIRQFVNCP